MHEFWFVSSKGTRVQVRPMQAVRKCFAQDWRKRAEYPIKGGSVVIHEYEKKAV